MRLCYWYVGLDTGPFLGGVLSWAFQHVHHAPTASDAAWKMLFVFLGCWSIVLGIAAFFVVPDSPMNAGFLKDEDKVNILERVRVNQSGIENRNFLPTQVLETLTDVPCGRSSSLLSL
jgi:sugar phosphate permease